MTEYTQASGFEWFTEKRSTVLKAPGQMETSGRFSWQKTCSLSTPITSLDLEQPRMSNADSSETEPEDVMDRQ